MEKGSFRLLGFVRKNSTLLGTLCLLAIAAAEPEMGARLYGVCAKPLMGCLFFLLGFRLCVSELADALQAWRVHCAIQLFSLGLTPLLFYATCYATGLARRVLGETVATGFMAAMCMPTTSNTNVMFTQQARGDVAVAAVNSAVGNLLGALVAPFVFSLAAGGAVAQQGALSLVVSLCETIVGPMLAGVFLQLACARKCAARPLQATNRVLSFVSAAVLISLIYIIFCKAFDGQSGGVPPERVAKLGAFTLLVHLVILWAAWLCAKLTLASERNPHVAAQRRVAFVMTAPQKTEGLGIAILAAIFDDDANVGALALPIVVYHTVQMIVAATLVAPLERHVEAHSSEDDISRSHRARRGRAYSEYAEDSPTTLLLPDPDLEGFGGSLAITV